MTKTKANPLITANIKLDGYVTSLQVMDKGQLVKDVPIKKHNLFLNRGKNFLINSLRGGNVIRPVGSVFAYASRGSGTTAAQATDTTLEAKIGNSTNTLVAGTNNNGTKYDRTSGTITFKRTFDFEAEASNVTISELGWSNDSSANINIRLLLGVSSVNMLQGQNLRVGYELNLIVPAQTATPITPSGTGGWTTSGTQRIEVYLPPTQTSYDSTLNNYTPSLITDSETDANTATLSPSATATGSNNSSIIGTASDLFAYKTTTHVFNTLWNAFSTSGWNTSATPNMTIVKDAYVDGSFERTFTVNFPPSSGTINFYALHFFGITHIFDNYQTKTANQNLTITFRIVIA